MRILAGLALGIAVMAVASARAQDATPTNEEVVKAVRAVLAAKKEGERTEARQKLLARTDLDPASFTAGLRAGPYYQKPMVTEVGERHSNKHFGLQWKGSDGRERGFSLFVPEAYDPKSKIPVLFYLHHNAYAQGTGTMMAGTALMKFRDLCEKQSLLFVAPYTGAGAEWWTPEGRRLVEWTLSVVKERYSVDENRIALLGALDGADAVWYLGQEMPGTWSCLMPMTGDPYEIGAVIRPLYLGTLDRMDILMGVPGKSVGNLGDKNVPEYLSALTPLFEKHMRITTTIWTAAQGDFHYLDKVKDLIGAFALERKRNAIPEEVDIETDLPLGQRCLWLESHGRDAKGPVAGQFPSTLLRWKAPKFEEPKKRLGIGLDQRPAWAVGMVITSVDIGARDAGLIVGDVLLEVDGKPARTVDDVAPILQSFDWGHEVKVLAAREVKSSELDKAVQGQRRYMKIREKVAKLRAEGKPVPANLNDLAEDEEGTEEEEGGCGDDDGCSIIEISKPEPKGKEKEKEDRGGARGGKSEKTEYFVFERWVKLVRPEGRMVRADFGAGWDVAHRESGVRVVNLVAGGHAQRSGFKEGDVIIQVGADSVATVRDLQAFFEGYKFEEEPEAERRVEFTVRRQVAGGSAREETVAVRWDPPAPFRVDAQWEKREKIMNVLTREVASFTIYFATDLMPPDQEFHLYVNGIPWADIADPASAPEYPVVGHGSDPMVADDLHRMRQRRAKVDGWKPDYAWAIDDALAMRDRELPLLAKRTFDLKGLAAAFEKARKREGGEDKGAKVKSAYDRHVAKG